MTSAVSLLRPALIAALAVAPCLEAQVVTEVLPRPPSGSTQAEGVRTITGEEIPQYFLVANFFTLATKVLGDTLAWKDLLDSLGIKVGTEAAEALVDAVAAAKEIRERSLPPAVERDEIEAAMNSLQKRNSRDLGKVWLRLRQRLSHAGHDLGQLDRYLDENIRSGSQLIIVEESSWEADLELGQIQEVGAIFMQAAGGAH